MVDACLGYYLGNLEQAFVAYSTKEELRHFAASGGMVSSVLLYLLKKGEIDGALVCRQKMVDGKVSAETFIARTADEILSAQGSFYFYIPLLAKIKEIEKFPGKLVVVALPCQISAFKKAFKNKRKLSKIFFVGLFCGHTSKKELLLKVLEKKGIKEENILRVFFRRGHWRGKMHILLNDKSEKIFPFGQFGTYQNLFFYCDRRCLACTNHTSEEADISCGDVWSAKYKSHPIKHSLVIARNNRSFNLLKRMEKEKEIFLQDISQKEVFQIQKRSLILHKHIKARSILGKMLGFSIPYSKKETSRWQDYLAAGIVLFNVKLAETKIGQELIFFIPRQIWLFYLVILKLLTSF